MYGFALRPVAISGSNGPRSPIFAAASNDIFSGGWRPAMGRPQPAVRGLGQTTDQEWYNEARREVAKFDSFVNRLRKVANKQVREDLAGRYVGSPEDSESGIYRRNSVASDIAEAESYTPVNVLVFSVERRRNRVRQLDSLNNGFERDLTAAEQAWGTLPEPQVIERIVEVQVPGTAPSTPPIVPILVVGGLAVAGLALLGVFGGQ